MNVVRVQVQRLVLVGLVGCLTTFSDPAKAAAILPIWQNAAPPPISDNPLAFEAVTIKPSDPNLSGGTYFRVQGRHVLAVNVSLFDLLSLAYGLHPKQIVNGPRWLDTSRYDIDGVPTMEGRPNRDQQRQLFRALLADRFHLVFHYEQRELPIYALLLDKGGPRLTRTSRQPQDGTNFSYTNQIVLTAKNASMATLADGMQASFLDRPVVDHTGLTDRYDFTLKWTPDDSPARDTPDAPPDLYTAIKEQLGLKLVPTKEEAKALVIDHVEVPSAN
ncbi:TIGR03435 family protein [Terriglobus albidus]|uniref:TIGR03435 family protein n=1 Tax=Terriglobus albidus TaxID=1592106 RepID=UPI0021DFAB44|nr:TIGR03435 family protein [Terriglobus albidus]